MSEWMYDEFGHLLVRRRPPEGWPIGPYWGHVHEEQALACSWFEHYGWPQP